MDTPRVTVKRRRKARPYTPPTDEEMERAVYGLKVATGKLPPPDTTPPSQRPRKP